MQINIVGRHIDVTPAIKSFVTEKLTPLEKRYNRITSIHVVLHVENVTHVAEGTIHVDGTDIHAKAEDHDMYKAIELLADKLLVQITKHKEKIIQQHQ